ncbi:MAG: hypothetical protein JWM26_4229 [Betaproteobacteria bacterium]|nr:hypothetical protein [Betaproteobacteria bacterium]
MKRKHHDLLAWQEAISLVKLVYQTSKAFPRAELYGLTSQMRRAAVSVPANIAEGAGRTSKKEFLQYLSIARGSLTELETYVVLAKELAFCSDAQELESSIDRVLALIGGLINSERAREVR